MATNADSIWKHLTTPGAPASTAGGSRGVNNAWQRLMTPDPSLVPNKAQQDEEERKRREAEAKKKAFTSQGSKPANLNNYISNVVTPPQGSPFRSKPVDPVLKGVKQGTLANFPSALKEEFKWLGKTAIELPKQTLYDPFVNPSETTKALENQIAGPTGNKFTDTVSAIPRTLTKGAVRILVPVVEGTGTQVGDIIFTREEAKALANDKDFQTIGKQVMPKIQTANTGKITAEEYVQTVMNSANLGLSFSGIATRGFGLFGDRLATRNTSLRVGPKEIRTVLDSGQPIPPQARVVLEHLAEKGKGFTLDMQRPAGGTRQAVGEAIGGKAKRATDINTTGEARTQITDGTIGNSKTPPTIREELGIVETPEVVPNKAPLSIREELGVQPIVDVPKTVVPLSVREQLVAEETKVETDGSRPGDWEMKRDAYLTKYPEVLDKQPWEMSWIEQEKVYVQGLLSQSKEFAVAKKAYESTEFGTPESRKAGRLVEKIDHEADIEITKLVKEAQKSPEALAKLNEYKGIETKSTSDLKLKAVETLTGEDLAKASEKDRKASELKEQLKGNIQIKKSDLATLLRNAPGFKENPVLTVSKDGKLVYETEGASFSMLPSALGLDSMAIEELKPGTKITIDTNDFLKADKTKNNVRVTKGGSTYAAKDSTKIGVSEQMPANKPETTPAKEGTPQFKLFEKVEGLIRKYAKLIGEGYLPRNARGVYYRDTQNIYIDGMTNVSVAAHEITHFLDHKYGIIKDLLSMTTRGALIRKQLTDLYTEFYSGGSSKHKLELRMREGYATLLQQYAMMPQTITAKYPDLVKEFLRPGGKYYQPVIGEITTDLHAMIEEYQGLSALDKIGAAVVTEDFKTNKGNYMTFWQQVRTITADEIYSQEVLDEGAGTANTDKSVSLLMRGMKNHSSAVFQSNLSGKNGLWTLNSKGEFVKVSDFNIGNLIQQLSGKNIMNEFAFYILARDGYFRYKNLARLKAELDSGIVGEDAKAELEKQYEDALSVLEKNPHTQDELTEGYMLNKDRFSEEEAMYDELTQKGQLDPLHDALLMDDIRHDDLSTREGYASNKRVFYNELLGDSEGPTSLGVGKTTVTSMMSRKGSSRAFQNPLFSLIKDHHEIMLKAGRQHIYNRFLNIAPKWTDLFEIEPLATDATGLSKQETDPTYIMARKKGKEGKIQKVPIHVDSLTKQMIDNIMNYEDLHIIEKLLRGAATIKTIGTTATYLPFAPINTVRDQFTAQVFSVNGYKPFYTAAKELIKRIDPNNPEHHFWKEFFVLGGDHYTLVSFETQTPEAALKAVARETTAIQKHTEMVASGVANLIKAPTHYSEVLTRAAEYTKARVAGKDQWTAMEDAQRVSGPFAHVGAWQKLSGKKRTVGQTFIKSRSFSNAAIAIFDQTIRTAATPQGRKRIAFMVALISAMVAAGLLYTKAKATEEQLRELKNTDPIYFTKYILVPKVSGKGFIRIPLPDNMSTVGALINMAVLDKWLGADYEKMEYARTITAVLPDQLDILSFQSWYQSYLPNAFSTTIQLATGLRLFPSPHPIENQSMKYLPSENRFDEKTSPVAKFLGNTGVAKKLGWSPVEIEFAITETFGRATGLAMGNKKAIDPLSGFDQNYNWKSNRSMGKYWDLKEKMDQDTAAVKSGLRDKVDPKNRGLLTDIDRALGEYKKASVGGASPEKLEKLQKTIEELAGRLE